MGTTKRERQKAGHQARVDAARAAQARADRRRRLTLLVGVAIFAVAVVGVATFLANRNKDTSTASSTTTATTAAAQSLVPPPPGAGATLTGTTPCPPAEGAERTTGFAQAPPMCIDPAKSYTAVLQTSAGPVTVALDTTRTPQTTNNFVVLSRYGFYDGTAVFRADSSIDILQGGAPISNSTSDPGPGYTIPDEGGKFTYQPGQLVMARTSQPNSAGAQFFFTTGPNASQLDAQGTYVVFGTVDAAGLALLQQAQASAQPDSSAGYSTPVPPLTIQGIQIRES